MPHVKCPMCVQPDNCRAMDQCLTAVHWARHFQALQALRLLPPPSLEGVKKKTLDKPKPAGQSPTHTRRTRQVSTTETTQQRIEADVAFARENDAEFIDYRGVVATTKIIRYVAALNADVPRKEFIDALVALGFNRNTVGIQFTQSRRESLECGDCTLTADGRLQDK
jgi:hypothetical protein